MKRSFSSFRMILVGLIAGLIAGAAGYYVWSHQFQFRDLEDEQWQQDRSPENYAGSVSCIQCHERFYKLWEPSHHGKAMQAVTPAFVEGELPALPAPIRIGDSLFSVDLPKMQMIEERDGARTDYPMLHALGGKNVYFFLTPLERGRLQVLPLSFDVRRQEWFNTTGSMVRHFTDIEDGEVDWRDPLLTFNTACYNCHVSQLDKNYDAESNSYFTTWKEPGINCEACHGPSQQHIEICEAVPEGTVPKNLRIMSWKDLSIEQQNDACTPCHAKARAIAPGFNPGDRFFDYYDLTCLESPDFYPDGRDLGENYTQTAWLMNPCARGGTLSCLHCHTSSGRFRFKDDPTASCLPCHVQRVGDIAAHSHHAGGEGAPDCVSCHMPITEFGRMLRSDHSFRPPSPAAGKAFDSPIACLICHVGRKPEWAVAQVERWHPGSAWQQKILHEGTLVDAARKGQWDRLPEMLAYLQQQAAEPVVVTSLLRLLLNCPDPEKWLPIRSCMSNASPLVRGAATVALKENMDANASASLLFAALKDDYRVVRAQAADALSRYPRDRLGPELLRALVAAEKEYMLGLEAQPDRWSSHYNLGNYHSDRGDAAAAIEAYKRALVLRKDVIPPYVNLALLISREGDTAEAVRYLKEAHAVDAAHGGVNFNLGLALAELNDVAGAEKHLRLALKDEHVRPQAAYNLAVIISARDPEEAISLCSTAAEAAPQDPRYAYTQAFYLNAQGRTPEAIDVLKGVVTLHRSYPDAWLFLGDCYIREKRLEDARAHFRLMLAAEDLPVDARRYAQQRLTAIQ